MADDENNTGTARAEKAYEAAASATPVNAKAPDAAASPKPAAPAAKEAKAEPAPASQPQPVKAEPAPVSQAQPVKAESAPEVKATTSVESAPSAKPAKSAPKANEPVRRKAAVKAEPAPKPKATPAVRAKRKPAASAASAKTAAASAQTAPTKPAAPVLKAAGKTANTKRSIFAGLFSNFMPEEKTMNMNANFAGIQEVMTEAQAKAKAAFEKSSSVLGEVSDFTKGNLEAVMESGKILAEGIQGIGSELVAEGRSNFEAMSGDIKELAAAKSPSDFFKVQGDMMRKNIDSAVAVSAKNSEAMLKLVSDAMAPISGRVSLAMEKVRQTSN